MVGLSAEGGIYRFLDLPDLADPSEYPPALSPDGRRVAYWTIGRTTDTPPERGQAQVAGYAVYDTQTGAVRRAPIGTAHGLWTAALFFTDAQTVVACYDQISGGYDDPDRLQAVARPAAPQVWRLADDERTQPSELAPLDPFGPAPARAGRVWVAGDRRAFLVDLTDGSSRPTAPARGQGVGRGYGTQDALSEDGRWLATVGGPTLPDKLPNRVTVHDLTGRDDAWVVRGSARTWTVVSWLTDVELLVLQQDVNESQPHGPARDQLVAISLDGGDSRVVTRFPLGGGGGGWLWALDLLASPTAPGVEPPHPWDPRVTWSGIVLVLLGAVWLIRQRRRRRGRP